MRYANILFLLGLALPAAFAQSPPYVGAAYNSCSSVAGAQQVFSATASDPDDWW